MGLKTTLAILTVALLVTGSWAASRERVIRSFNDAGTGGYSPYSGLVIDSAGNLYGTTFFGGSGSCVDNGSGCGTVFELTPKAGGGWTEIVLYNFKNDGKDGTHPAPA